MSKKVKPGWLRIKVTLAKKVLFDEYMPADEVIDLFKAFLMDHPELLPFTCSGKILFHPKLEAEG